MLEGCVADALRDAGKLALQIAVRVQGAGGLCVGHPPVGETSVTLVSPVLHWFHQCYMWV